MSERWWTRNRWAVLALPVVFVLACAGNAIRVGDYWWNTDLHDRTAGKQGEWVTYHQDFTDGIGETSRTLEVRLDSVEELGESPTAYGNPIEIPDGLRGIRVNLSFKADPDQSVVGCMLGLRGPDGDRYEFDEGFAGVEQGEGSPCYIFGQSGPQPAFSRYSERTPGDPRPESWRTEPVVLVPEGAEVTEVMMWWEKPGYLQWELGD